MGRRIAGTVCFASALMMILWLATGATASGFVKFLLLGIVGSIFVLYNFDQLASMIPRPTPMAVVDETPDGGVFGTDLPAEAFSDPVIEAKTVNLSRSDSGSAPKAPLFDGNAISSDGTTASNGTSLNGASLDGTSLDGTADSNGTSSNGAGPSADTFTSNGNGSSPAVGHSVQLTNQSSNGNGQTTEVVASSEPTFIQLSDYSNDDLVKSVRAGEASLVSALTETGMLSTEGDLTDTDVATMVFVAVSSDDLLRALLEGKEAEAQAAALSFAVDTPELYEPAPQLVEPRS